MEERVGPEYLAALPAAVPDLSRAAGPAFALLDLERGAARALGDARQQVPPRVRRVPEAAGAGAERGAHRLPCRLVEHRLPCRRARAVRHQARVARPGEQLAERAVGERPAGRRDDPARGQVRADGTDALAAEHPACGLPHDLSLTRDLGHAVGGEAERPAAPAARADLPLAPPALVLHLAAPRGVVRL